MSGLMLPSSSSDTPAPAPKPKPSSASEALNVLWFAQGQFGLAKSVFDSVIAHMPQFLHAVTVSVVGGPRGDLRRAWFMACSIAFGRIRKSPALNGGSATMQATWDVTNKIAQIELVYQCAKMAYSEDVPRPSAGSGLPLGSFFSGRARIVGGGMAIAGGVAAALALPPPAAPSPKTSPIALIQSGPDQLTIGAGWPLFLLAPGQSNGVAVVNGVSAVIAQVPVGTVYSVRPLGSSGRGAGSLFADVLREFPITSGAAGGATFLPYQVISPLGLVQPSGTPVSLARAPALPDDGRIVTTGEKNARLIQPPKPPIDGTTRSSLVALVSAALSEPCFLPAAPPLTAVPLYSTGFPVYPTGASLNYPSTVAAINASRGTPGVSVLPDLSPDGNLPIPSAVTDQRN